MIRVLVLSVAVALTSGTLALAQAPFTLQPGDALDISVLEDPGLNRQVLIRPDGLISLPLAGSIQAAGLTPEAVQDAVRRRLSDDFIEPPNVTVSVAGLLEGFLEEEEEPILSSIYIIGQVPNPGLYQIEPPINVLQALSLAGGPGVFAARERIQVRRREGGADTVFFFDYDQIEDGIVPTQSVDLADGDVIVVPERGLFD